MVRKPWFVSKIPLPLSSIDLGRFVTSRESPAQAGFFDPHDKLPTKPKPEWRSSEVLTLSHTVDKAIGTKLELVMAMFASAFFNIDVGQVRALETCQMTQYFILNADDWFDMVCAEESFREWIERRRLDNRTVYLVTDFCTLKDPSISVEVKSKVSAGGSIQPPLVALAGGPPVPTPLDPEISPKVKVSNTVKNSYQVADEKVFWIAYQRVKISKNKLDEAVYRLDKKREWIEICDILDANLDQYSIEVDLTNPEPGAGIDAVDLENETFSFEDVI